MSEEDTSQATSESIEDTSESEKSQPSSEAKMIPETQLVATKKEYKSKLKNLQKAHDEVFQQNLKLQGQVETLTEKANQTETLQSQLSETNNRLYLSEEYRKSLEAGTTETLASTLVKNYNLTDEAVNGKSLDELKQMQEILSLVGSSTNGSGSKGYAAASSRSAGDGSSPNTFDEGMAEARSIVAQTKRRQGIPVT